MDFYVLDGAGKQRYHNHDSHVPEHLDNVSFDCGLDSPCLIQAVPGTYPTFNYKKQVISMPLQQNAKAPADGGDTDAAPLCECRRSDKAGYSSDDGWIMCTFACGDYPNACPNPVNNGGNRCGGYESCNSSN